MFDPLESDLRQLFSAKADQVSGQVLDVAEYHRRSNRILARRKRAVVSSAVLGVLVVVGGAAELATRNTGSTGPAMVTQSSPRSVVRPDEQQRAAAEVNHALDQMQLPPEAKSVATSPSNLLIPATAIPAQGHLASAVRWWIVKGQLADTRAFLVAHPPPGLKAVQGAISNNGVQYLQYEAQQPGRVLRVIINLGAVQIGDTVGLDITASEIWGAT
ncbi:hypothetical protein acdb102_33660 [Acidothermaceae bacterium B102]|nr:hypothetical protein acdb102_33660 [Acidothermaceae bacterium B102]